MTPTAPLSAQEQIEYVATKVMGWQIPKHGHGFDDLPPMVEDDTGYVHTSWNPLTDWNHWRQVEEKVMEDEDLSLVWVRLLTKELSMTMWDAVWRADLPTRVAALIQAHKELSPPQK